LKKGLQGVEEKGKLVTKAILLISKLSYDPRKNIERKYISDIKTLLVFHP